MTTSKIRGEIMSSKDYPAEITKAEENTPFDVVRESKFFEELTNGKARKFLEEMSKKEKEKKTLFSEMDLKYEHDSCGLLSKDEAMRYLEDMRKKEEEENTLLERRK